MGLFSASHATHVIVICLIVVVGVTIVEVNVPRIGSITCICSRRPVVGRGDKVTYFKYFSKNVTKVSLRAIYL